MEAPSKPQRTLRWAILGTGKISTRFASDLLIDSVSGPKHLVVAVGSSSIEKGRRFAELLGILQSSKVYDNYNAVYADADVEIVYVGTPHAFHYINTLGAISAGKHVLCEKPLAMNAREAMEMIQAARAKKVFFMEGVWTRFFELTQEIQVLLHDRKVIGSIRRVFVDFGLDQKIETLPQDSRLRSAELGAGVLLDIGVYTLMWGLLLFERGIGYGQTSAKDSLTSQLSAAEMSITASSVIKEGIDISTSIIMQSKRNECQAILTSTLLTRSGQTFARIEGSKGCITIQGAAPSKPDQFTVKLQGSEKLKVYKFERIGNGLRQEADAVALDIFRGDFESKIMPLDESLAVMKLLDAVRECVGLKYSQDDN